MIGCKTFRQENSNKKPYKLDFAYNPINYIKSGGSRNRLDNIAMVGAFSSVRYMVPYLDYRVIDYAVSIPRYNYLKNGQTRAVFREAFKDIMPDSMYKLNVKEDRNVKGLEENKDWYESYAKRKMEIISNIDKEFWGKYLNLDKIDELANAGKPGDEEFEKENAMQKVLLKCALAHKLISNSRKMV